MKMKPITIVKIAIDLAMTVLFLLLMEYHLLSDAPHEWIGASVFLLFLGHNVLNYRWYKNLFKGKYTATRILQTTVNFLLWIAMLGCIVSAMCISGHVFAFMNIGAARFGRTLHLAATVWAFLLMSFHLGLHFQMFIGMARNILKPGDTARVVLKWIGRAVVLGISAFAVYVFIQRTMWEEMFLLTEFKWYDYEKTILGYFFESAAIMVSFAAVGYYLKLVLQKMSSKSKKRARANSN